MTTFRYDVEEEGEGGSEVIAMRILEAEQEGEYHTTWERKRRRRKYRGGGV